MIFFFFRFNHKTSDIARSISLFIETLVWGKEHLKILGFIPGFMVQIPGYHGGGCSPHSSGTR